MIYNLPKDNASDDVLRYVHWPTFSFYYRLDVFRLFVGHIANPYLI